MELVYFDFIYNMNEKRITQVEFNCSSKDQQRVNETFDNISQMVDNFIEKEPVSDRSFVTATSVCRELEYMVLSKNHDIEISTSLKKTHVTTTNTSLSFFNLTHEDNNEEDRLFFIHDYILHLVSVQKKVQPYLNKFNFLREKKPDYDTYMRFLESTSSL